MVFASPIFLFIFLPVFFAVYLLSRRRWRNLVLVLASLLFYMWGEPKLVVVMLSSTVVDYFCALIIANGSIKGMWREPRALLTGQARTRLQKGALWLSIGVNLGFLAFFKYANFGLANVHRLFDVLGLHAAFPQHLAILLPLGISFYTFQSMSYTIDVFRGHTTATKRFIDYACLITKFPLLIAGPIIRYADVAEQLRTRVITRAGFAEGIRRFVVGLGKKVLIANTMAVVADQVFRAPAGSLSKGAALIGVISYTLQIYFDFSGYSDMAIGLGRMLGFRFLENFNYPYIARSMQDFWRRWHMSLSSWFRDYVYIPLGGNRHGTLATYRNLILTFFLTGLWHGASWTFVIWGLWHGLFLIVERVWPQSWRWSWAKPVQHLYVLAIVMIGWILFRADSMHHAWAIFQTIWTGQGQVVTAPLLASGKVVSAMVLGGLGAMPLLMWLGRLPSKAGEDHVSPQSTIRLAFVTAALAGVFLLSLMQLASGTYNPFIYFRF